ncbi:sodium:calcium antiporter [Pelagibacteraceae bacterium]|nr:sodium:calcium antiporter [Pelagibacteraceae bacterium]
MNLLFIIGGILSLGIGAELIVRGAVNLSNLYKLSGYFIGFTIVAFGTSIPELSATLSAISYPEINSVGIALGNIIGSNIANILLIVGIIAIIKDIEFANQKQKKDETVIVLFITFGIVALFIGLAESQLNSPATMYVGIVLICILLAYLIWEYIIEKNTNAEEIIEEKTFSQFLSYIFLIVGLTLLIIGSYYFVLGAKNLATSFGISEAIIGFTLVAFGTSLPELATGVAAALKNQTKIAVGTILGSNVYNIVGIFAVILFVRGDDFPTSIDLYLESLLIMALATIIFTLKVRKGLKIGSLHFKPYRIGKKTGTIFLLFYFLYLIYSYY